MIRASLPRCGPGCGLAVLALRIHNRQIGSSQGSEPPRSPGRSALTWPPPRCFARTSQYRADLTSKSLMIFRRPWVWGQGEFRQDESAGSLPVILPGLGGPLRQDCGLVTQTKEVSDDVQPPAGFAEEGTAGSHRLDRYCGGRCA